MTRRVLLTGATGFIGRRAFSALVDAGWDVVCASRDAEERSHREPTRTWVRFDVHEPSTVDDALQNIDAVLYLIHSMGQTGDSERAFLEPHARARADSARRGRAFGPA